MEGVDIVDGVDADTARDGCPNCPFLGARLSSVKCPERLSRESLVGWTEVSETVETVSRRSLSVSVSVSVSRVGGFRKSSFAEGEQ